MTNHVRFWLRCAAWAIVALAGGSASAQTSSPLGGGPAKTNDPQEQTSNVDPKWLERLASEDRAAIDELIGYAPPPFTADLKWFQTPPLDWKTLRGKVVVVQSWTTGSTAGRAWPARVAATLKDVDRKDLVIIALHTPESADTAEVFMKKQKPPEDVAVVVDPVGEFCDALGVFKHPVNVVVDRNGAVRYAGLNNHGLKGAVTELVQQPFDPKSNPPPRPREKPAEEKTREAGFPPIKGNVSGATDLRGKRAPEFMSDQWYTTAPQPAGKVVVITFWNSIEQAASLGTHAPLNDLATRFGDRVSVVVISADSKSDFESEMLRRRMNKSDFKYAVAFDRNSRMAKAVNVAAPPYTIVMSKDWTVRWQGRPNELRANTLQEIIEADAATGPSQPGQTKKRGWKNS